MKVGMKEPLVIKYKWAVLGLITAFSLYGIISFAGQRILSSMIMKNRMDISTYQSIVYNFNLIMGILASAALAVFFAASIMGTAGSRRAGFIVGSISAAAPIFGALSTTILFQWLRLPAMGAGSVIASAASAVLIILPCFIMFAIFACCKKLKLNSRLLGLLAAFLSLLVAFFPVTVTILALVVMPGNPAVAPFMNLSAYLIHVRPIMIALGFAILYLMNKNNPSHQMQATAVEETSLIS